MIEEKILKEQIVNKFGLVIRLVKYSNASYEVLHTPLYTDGTFDDEFYVFGGGVGMSCSSFTDYRQADTFYYDVINLTSEEMLNKYPYIWYGD